MLENTNAKTDARRLPESPWYECDDSCSLSETVIAVLEYLEESSADTRQGVIRHMRLYGGGGSAGYGPYSATQTHTASVRFGDRLSMNVIASNTDTYVSKMAKNSPRSRFLTDGGNFTQQRRAKGMQEFIDGMGYLLRLREMGLDMVRDSCVFGDGLIYFYRVGADIMAERVFPGEVFVDSAQALYGDPQEFFRVKFVDRGVLMGMYGDSAEALRAIENSDSDTDAGSSGSSRAPQRDIIKVIMAWHLPSKKGAKDGRFVTCVEGGVLSDVPYIRDMSPFVKLQWKKPLTGYWGHGIAEELTGIQIEINKLLKKIQAAQHLLGVPWVLRPVGSRANPAQIQNIPGLIVDYYGDTPPTVVTHRTVNPEIYEHLQRLIDYSYEITGISQLSAGSQKPPGLNSGVALQEYSDIGTERFQDQGRRFEDVYAIDFAQHIISLAKEIADDKDVSDSCTVNAITKDTIKRIKWDDVALPLDDFTIQVFPTSGLPTHPAAKQERVMELLNAKLIDPAQAMQLLDFPDMKAYSQLRDAPLEDIAAIIEILESGGFESPEPFTDLARARPMVQAAYLRARRTEAPDDVLENFRTYILELDALTKRVAAYESAQMANAEMSAAGAGPVGPSSQPASGPPTGGPTPADAGPPPVPGPGPAAAPQMEAPI